MKILLVANAKWENYARAISALGATPVVKYLPDDDVDYDGLVLCGGNDINPRFYNQELNGSRNLDTARDETEINLLKHFIDTGKPILGICRGLQLLNVALGGTLVQDINDSSIHCSGTDFDLVHRVEADDDSIFKRLYGNSFCVNSYHHQAIDTLGDGLVATLYCGDRIEGIEHQSKPYFAVQFHPERMCLELLRNDTVDGIKIFEYFLDMCRNFKSCKADEE